MTPSEIDELERLCAEATPGPWLLTGDATLVNVTHTTRDVWTFPRTEADMVYLGGLLNAAPALIAAAREVDRLRAFVPRWRMKRYSPTAVTWRLFVGNTAIPGTGLHPTDAGRVFASGDGEGYPDLPTAARAVCTRLGIPYVPVEVDDG